MKKLNYIIIIIPFLFFNCKKEERKPKEINSDFYIKIKSIKFDTLNNHIYVDCLIKNPTNEKLYFPIDNETIKFFNIRQKIMNVNAFYAIFYKDQDTIYADSYISPPGYLKQIIKIEDSLKKINGEQTKNKNIMHWEIMYNRIKKNSFYIPSHSSLSILLNLDLDFTMYKEVITYDISKYNKESLINSELQIAIRVDSMEAKNLLLFKDLDSLKRNNIKIFHGELRSNKVPLIVQ